LRSRRRESLKGRLGLMLVRGMGMKMMGLARRSRSIIRKGISLRK
jgi:hypothetical protein